MKDMNSNEVAELLKKNVGNLADIFINRNMQYASEDNWDSNFRRNAKYNQAFRISEIIDKPYGVSIHYVLQKIDRLINGIIELDGRLSPVFTKNIENKYPAIRDSIDDAIIYLFITKMLLVENNILLKDVEGERAGFSQQAEANDKEDSED